MTLSVELTWALAASALLLAEQSRHRRSLDQEVRTLRNSHDVVIRRNEELTQATDEMGRLYRNQLLTSRKQAARLKKVLEIATSINSDLTLDKVLHEIVHAVADAVGFRIVLLRVLDERTGAFDARAFAGLDREAIEKLEQYNVPREEFESWLREEFRISRSYFISHKAKFWPAGDAEGYTPNLGERKEGEWHRRGEPRTEPDERPHQPAGHQRVPRLRRTARLVRRATSARNFAGAIAADSSPRPVGRMEFSGDGQNDQANVDANRSHPYWSCASPGTL